MMTRLFFCPEAYGAKQKITNFAIAKMLYIT